MKNRRNYYRILHIQPDAPADIIKASYRTQMQKLRMHPDLGGDEWDASVLNEAYRVLSDPDKRAAYDATFLAGKARPFDAARSDHDRAGGRYRSTGANEADAPVDMSACPFCRTPRPVEAACEQHPFCTGCGGPLQVATCVRPVSNSERYFQRMPYNARVTVFRDNECRGQSGNLRDLSPAGMQLRLTLPLVTGQLVRIASTEVACIGRVMYCNRSRHSGQFHAGIAFITVHFVQRSGTFLSENA